MYPWVYPTEKSEYKVLNGNQVLTPVFFIDQFCKNNYFDLVGNVVAWSLDEELLIQVFPD